MMGNRELVELFISALSDLMAVAVLQYLGNKEGTGKIDDKQNEMEVKMIRRPENRYDLENVCKVAVHVLESSQGMFYLMNKSVTEPVKK